MNDIRKETAPFIILRDDGFSQFFEANPEEPIEKFIEDNVGYLRDYPGVKIKVMGVGPGSVFTYDTKVGDVFMQNVTPLAEKICRKGDLSARDMVKKLNESGKDGMTRVVEKCREMGILLWARFEMNHEYGPTNEDNFGYACFVGRFNKEHPEYRVTKPDGSPLVNPMLDFKHKEVRNFKLAIIREAAQHGVDGVSLDFCVYPPFFTDSQKDGHFMTDLIRDARRVLDEEGEKQGKHIDLCVRVDQDCEAQFGMEWRTWVHEGLIDWIAPSYRFNNGAFEAPVEDFLRECEGTDCRVITSVFTANAGRVNADPNPYDARSGKLGPKERPYQVRRFYARAYAGIKSGASAVQLETSTGNMIRKGSAHWHDMLDKLTDMEFLRRTEKEYNFNNMNKQCVDVLPVTLTPQENFFEHSVIIGDETEDIESATLIIMARGFTANESLTLTVNGHEMLLTEKEFHWSPLDEPFLPTKGSHGIITKYNTLHLARIDHWWDVCRNDIEIPAEWLKAGRNEFTFTYHLPEGQSQIRPLNMGEMSLVICPKQDGSEQNKQ